MQQILVLLSILEQIKLKDHLFYAIIVIFSSFMGLKVFGYEIVNKNTHVKETEISDRYILKKEYQLLDNKLQKKEKEIETLKLDKYKNYIGIKKYEDIKDKYENLKNNYLELKKVESERATAYCNRLAEESNYIISNQTEIQRQITNLLYHSDWGYKSEDRKKADHLLIEELSNRSKSNEVQLNQIRNVMGKCINLSNF